MSLDVYTHVMPPDEAILERIIAAITKPRPARLRRVAVVDGSSGVVPVRSRQPDAA
jgi:hypothetical protein